MLQNLQSEIAELEKALEKLDILNESTPEMGYKLRSGRHHPSWDSAQKDLYRDLEKKLQVYGMCEQSCF